MTDKIEWHFDEIPNPGEYLVAIDHDDNHRVLIAYFNGKQWWDETLSDISDMYAWSFLPKPPKKPN